MAKPFKIKTTVTSSRATRLAEKSSSDDEKTDTNKEEDSQGSDKEANQKGAEAKGPFEFEKNDKEDTSTPPDKKSKKPRSEQQTAERGKVSRGRLCEAGNYIRETTGWSDPVDSLLVYAYIAKSKANEAWVEEKRKRDEEAAGTSKKATRSSTKKEEVPKPSPEVNMEDSPKDKKQGVCGRHFSHDIISRKILQAGFVWPSLHRDVRHWCQSCHRCQLAGDRCLTYEPQTPILAHGPFEDWGIDAIGSLPRATSGKLYIIMGVNYMTRWAEATTTSRITAVEVAKFIFEHICCRFGVPLEIFSDRGPGFRGDLVGELMKKLKIKRRHSTPYYPQCNGLVEKVNGMICKIITKQVVSTPKEWDKHLEAALWSYRTSFRTSLGYTLYHLVFGKEAILPIEVQLASLRVLESGRETPKEQLQQRILDLERLELDRTSAIEFYATQAEKR
ncbi:hypothetical protein L7F22_053131 [Adiantum nelumboides]|nr:hypothetical protein [Adiantum nelumboides]